MGRVDESATGSVNLWSGPGRVSQRPDRSTRST